MKILLVEDDDVDVMTVERALSRSRVDYSLQVIRRGLDAIEDLMQKSEAQDELPDVVLLDLNLPMLSGLEFLERCTKEPRLAALPVVVLTTSANEDDVVQAMARGASGYFVKPVGFDEFVTMMTSVCHYWSLSIQAAGPSPPSGMA